MALQVDCALFLLVGKRISLAPTCLHHVSLVDISGVTSQLQGCGLTTQPDQGPST